MPLRFVQGEKKRSDVDVIVVTNIDKEKYTPRQAMDLFIPFLDKYYEGREAKDGPLALA